MARGRMVNTTVATDKRLADLTIEFELLFLKTIPHLDRDGLILGDAPILWAQVCPRRPDLLPVTEDAIRQWITAGLVIAYDTTDGRALLFPNFAKNQTGLRYDREPASTIECPPGYIRTDSGLALDDSPATSGKQPDAIRQTSGTDPAEVKLKEKNIEGKVREENPPPKPKPPKPKPEPDPTLKDPAVIAFRNRTHITPDPEWRKRIAATVTDCERWDNTIVDWLGSGWNKRNVKGMLEVYENGPRARSNGREPKPDPKLEALRMLEEEDPSG